MLKEMSEEKISLLESQLLALVPAEGSIGNRALLRALEGKGWDDKLYWGVRKKIMDRGILITGRGRGGSVKRATSIASPMIGSPTEAVTPFVPTAGGADVLEMQLETGGRLLAVVQGRVLESDIAELQRLLRARYLSTDSAVHEEQAEALAEVTADPSSGESTHQDYDDEIPGELELKADAVSFESLALAPERRTSRDSRIESLVCRFIQAIDQLQDASRERQIIVARYGLGDEGSQTLGVIGTRHNITREYVRQIESNVLARLGRYSGVRGQAKEALIPWMRQSVDALAATGALLTDTQIRIFLDDWVVVDGWVRLVLDIAFPRDGGRKLFDQLVALADLALHRYRPFNVNCWVSDPDRISSTFPIVEAWLEELDGDNHALPLSAETFAGLLGVEAADVIAVVSAHPRFSVYAGYVFNEKVNREKKRAVRAHIVANLLAPDAAPLSQFALWKAYRTRFQDIDACSANDIRIALSDNRGAPHLFIVDTNNSLFALGQTAACHGLDLRPRFQEPEPDQLEGIAGQMIDELCRGPLTAEVLAEHLDITLESVIPTLGQRSEFVSITPRYYGLTNQASNMGALSWQERELHEEDALEIIGCFQAGEEPEAVYPGWSPAFEQALCTNAQNSGWRCLPNLLWACKPESWPISEHEKARWIEKKATASQPPPPVSLPTGTRLPDPERLLRFLLVARHQRALSIVMANRVTRPRSPLQQINGTLIAILVRVGALQSDADTYWAKHRAGPELERWYSLLSSEYLQNGRLDWNSGACLAMAYEAASKSGAGWAGELEWTQRIRNGVSARGVDFDAMGAAATEVEESDEASGVALDAEGTDSDIDLLSEAEAVQADEALLPEEMSVEDGSEESEEALAQLVSQLAFDESPAANREAPGASAKALDSVAALVAKARSGDAEAQYRLAKQLQDGVGAAPNPHAAVYWLSRAADANHVPACVRLGRMLLTGEIGDGTVRERQQGLVYLNVGTKAGNPQACYLLAKAYSEGKLMRKNPQAAVRLLKRAARGGHGKASYELAVFLRRKMGCWVPDSIRWLRQAAEKGVGDAAVILESSDNTMTTKQMEQRDND